MRRTIFLALLAALLFAPAATARAAADPIEILRDCADDDVLQGTYTIAELRNARSHLPTDADEYSSCRDVLSRAITRATAASKTPTPSPTVTGTGTGGGAGGDLTGGGTAGSGSTGSGDHAAGTDDSRQKQDEAILSAPSSPADAQAVGSAEAAGGTAIKAELQQRDPGNARLAASVGRNGLPTTMIAVLVLIAAALVAAFLPLLRRRRGLPRHPGP